VTDLGGILPGPRGIAAGPEGIVAGPAGLMPVPANVMPGPAGITAGPVGLVPGPAGIMPGPAGIMPGPAGIMPGPAGVTAGPVGLMPCPTGVMPVPGGIIVTSGLANIGPRPNCTDPATGLIVTPNCECTVPIGKPMGGLTPKGAAAEGLFSTEMPALPSFSKDWKFSKVRPLVWRYAARDGELDGERSACVGLCEPT
jgi:hypothetical protein